jgi:hypothetical protein
MGSFPAVSPTTRIKLEFLQLTYKVFVFSSTAMSCGPFGNFINLGSIMFSLLHLSIQSSDQQ